MYSAILLSTLGVRLPRLPFMLDTPISAVSFLDGLDSRQVEALWSSENIGKPYLSVPECQCPNVQHCVANHHSNFLFHGRQPWQIANNAVDSDGKAERRERLRPYVEQFARYFSRECIVMPLTQHLLAADETRSALQAVLDEMRSAATSGGAVGKLLCCWSCLNRVSLCTCRQNSTETCWEKCAHLICCCFESDWERFGNEVSHARSVMALSDPSMGSVPTVHVWTAIFCLHWMKSPVVWVTNNFRNVSGCQCGHRGL